MPEQAFLALVHAARIRMVAATLAQLLVMLGVLAIVPALVALGLGPQEVFQRLAITAAGLMSTGLVLLHLPGTDLSRVELQWNEALAVTALAFLLAAATMVWPMTAAGIGPLDALLESVSAVTTTGLTILRHPDIAHPGLLFLRAWMQWYGGLGIAVLALALIMHHHGSARRLLETTGEQLTRAGARHHARTVFVVYAALTVLTLAAVWATGVPAFEALLFTLPAVATGGFAPAASSLAALPVPAIAVLTVATLLGAVTLPLYAQVPARGLGVLRHDAEVRALLVAVLLTGLSLAGLLGWQRGLDWAPALGQGFALGISAQTDTGFSTTDVASLPPGALLVLMLSMTVGGCTGSTAGGLKLVRVLILLRLVQLALRRTAVPERAVLHARVGSQLVTANMIGGALQLLTLWLVVLLVSWFVFLLYGLPPLASLFEVVSATANAGLSTGLTGPELTPALKLVLIIDMLFGRVEVLALLVLLYPPTWIGRRRKT